MPNNPPHRHGSGEQVCPPWLAFVLESPWRRWLHDPNRILAGLIEPGQTALDLGCGPGFFSTAMAHRVGEAGKVIAVDVQAAMLDRARRRAEREGVVARIRFHQCRPDRLGVDEPVDFALAFAMVHEVPDAKRFLAEVRGLLKPDARFLVAEPRWHVTEAAFGVTLSVAGSVGLAVVSRPSIRASRAALLAPDGGR